MYQRNGVEQDAKTKKWVVKFNGKVMPIQHDTAEKATGALLALRVAARRKAKP
jgi:hypothetical protein